MRVSPTETSTGSVQIKAKEQKWNSEGCPLPIGWADGLSLSADFSSRKREVNPNVPDSWSSISGSERDRNANISSVSFPRSCDLQTEKAQAKCHTTSSPSSATEAFELDSCGVQRLVTSADKVLCTSYLQFVISKSN